MFTWRQAGVLAALVAVSWVLLWPRQSGPDDILRPVLNASYDYVIVGAGSAGSVLAARLSEEAGVSVLLVEAGGDDRNQPLLDVPFNYIHIPHTRFDWEYYTEPQDHACKAFKEERMFWPRGKVLGGSSSINSMIYIRGSRHDYDAWAQHGVEGWSYREVLPYFLKSEGNQNPAWVDKDYHGSAGPLKVTDNYQTALLDVWLQAARQAGYKVHDVNGRDLEGFAPTQATIYKGERWSTSKGFLWPVIGRPNLHVTVNSHVTRVVIDNKRATGVEFIKDGVKKRVGATREVILAAGAVGSPQILMLSGVGPRKHLDSLQIPVLADLPVGENLQDHVMLGVGSSINSSVTLPYPQAWSLPSRLLYSLLRAGPLASNYGGDSNAFLQVAPRSPDSAPPDLAPPVQLQLSSIDQTFLFNDVFLALKDQVRGRLLERWNTNSGNAFKTLVMLMHPKSRGWIRLRSRDPFDHPVIQPNYLSHPDDVSTLVAGVRIVERLLKTEAFRKIGAKLDTWKLPLCVKFPENSDAYWACAVRAYASTVYHPVGTCKMGSLSDPTAVTDPQLRVKGVSGLRVADASVMPDVITGNINAPVIMVAEKAADLIRGVQSVQPARGK